MKFGVCNPYTNIKLIKSEGYDYIELGFAGMVAMSDSEFAKVYNEVEKHSFPAEAYNGFFPAEVPLVGDNADAKAIRDHARRGFDRAREIGGKVVVLGSGKARNIPDGFDRKRAEEPGRIADHQDAAGRRRSAPRGYSPLDVAHRRTGNRASGRLADHL